MSAFTESVFPMSVPGRTVSKPKFSINKTGHPRLKKSFERDKLKKSAVLGLVAVTNLPRLQTLEPSDNVTVA